MIYCIGYPYLVVSFDTEVNEDFSVGNFQVYDYKYLLHTSNTRSISLYKWCKHIGLN